MGRLLFFVIFVYTNGRMKDILVTGIQPTGPLHIGNYIGAVKNLLKLQNEYEGRCFVFVADYHSITEDYDPKEKQSQVLMMAAELLALGLDPKKAVLYVQSDVPEVTELVWIFNTITPVSFLERMTQYKDKAVRQKGNVNAGLLEYPVLQAADILMVGGTAVPVGDDQVQHVELARDIVRFFNRKFGETFSEPKALLTTVPRVMALNDPSKKMSKSLPNSFVSLCESPEEIGKKIRAAVTDVGPQGKKMGPGVSNLLDLLKEFGAPSDARKVEADFAKGVLKYVDLKDLVARRIAETFADFRKKRAALLANPARVRKILKEGAAKVRPVARKTMEEARKKVGLQ